MCPTERLFEGHDCCGACGRDAWTAMPQASARPFHVYACSHAYVEDEMPMALSSALWSAKIQCLKTVGARASVLGTAEGTKYATIEVMTNFTCKPPRRKLGTKLHSP